MWSFFLLQAHQLTLLHRWEIALLKVPCCFYRGGEMPKTEKNEEEDRETTHINLTPTNLLCQLFYSNLGEECLF